ncbi:putative metalloprotease CJM1_0395 family protein [Colwellia piezophila]|uniref:putative metalloprotease CJM1_0395 family protein n=1 Tax=Colwellia piezophila TaxID=211668 RepID=UPI0003707A6C|nr:putative metalloprotease CJM1_0395 family protein [Colwellia piezophila]
MNITPHTTSLPLATVVNPPTEGLRRENHQREIITQVTATNPAVAEKAVASDKERARTPAQVNEQVDFANLRKQTDQAATSITEQEHQQGAKEGNPQHNPQQDEQSAQHETPESDQDSESAKQAHADETLINQLQKRDKEVRTHELAHATVGGAATGSPAYTFEIGPDGKKYAVGGEVAVDLSSVAGDPQATITKMKKVHAAALAPTNPSIQDTRVAANAAKIILAAQSELLALNSNLAPETHISSASNLNASATLNEDYIDESNEFDALMNQTLSAQEAVISSASKHKFATSQSNNKVQSNEVLQRAHRIETFYFKVSQGYEKSDNFQFELTA